VSFSANGQSQDCPMLRERESLLHRRRASAGSLYTKETIVILPKQ